MAAHTLHLKIVELIDADHWRWVLTHAEGTFFADQVVALDRTEPQYQALLDLPGYLKHYAAPDKRDVDERQLIDEVGAWMGQKVLGPGVGEAILDQGTPPIIVRVVVPPAAERLLFLPLETAHANGRALGLQGVSLVFEVAGAAPPPAEPVGDRLRMLAVFSCRKAERCTEQVNDRVLRRLPRCLARAWSGGVEDSGKDQPQGFREGSRNANAQGVRDKFVAREECLQKMTVTLDATEGHGHGAAAIDFPRMTWISYLKFKSRGPA
jgi:hypothetical protein